MGVVTNILRGVIRPAIRSVDAPRGDAISWSSYWATLISATVENAAPTDVVLTFPEAKPSLLATDITCTVNGVARTVSSASWTGAVWTVVLASAVEYADVVVVTLKISNTANVTNNVLTYAALLTSTGTGAGVSTLRMQVSSNITVTLGANAKFYTNSEGTEGESATWEITSGALRTIYLKCTTGTSKMTFSDASKIIAWGDAGTDGWSSPINAAIVTLIINKFQLTHLRINGPVFFIGALPTMLQYARLNNAGIAWTYNGALPAGLTYISIASNNIAWTYNGALPAGLINIYIGSNASNWTGLDIGNTGNMTALTLNDYRITKMSSADMITLLTQMTNRAGTLPATVTINDYADYASPPAGVVTAVNTLKAAKSITTVNLGA